MCLTVRLRNVTSQAAIADQSETLILERMQVVYMRTTAEDR